MIKGFIFLFVILLLEATSFMAHAQNSPPNLSPGTGNKIYKKLKDSPPATRKGQLGIAGVLALHPLQARYGKREAKVKAKELEKLDKKELRAYLINDAIPVVIGPDGNYYITDHHHEDVAARIDHVDNVVIEVKGVFTGTMEEFWKELLVRHWVYPYDQDGRGPLKWNELEAALPKNVRGLKNDPYRSLSGFARNEGAYHKQEKDYFIEFTWANFFRNLIKIKSGKNGFKKALKKAIKLAHSSAAEHLPGYVPANKCDAMIDVSE